MNKHLFWDTESFLTWKLTCSSSFFFFFFKDFKRNIFFVVKMEFMELREAFYFICSLEFWRMAIFWTLSLIISYLQLFAHRIFSVKSKRCLHSSPPLLPQATRSVPSATDAFRRPICIITGVNRPIKYLFSIFSASLFVMLFIQFLIFLLWIKNCALIWQNLDFYDFYLILFLFSHQESSFPCWMNWCAWFKFNSAPKPHQVAIPQIC